MAFAYGFGPGWGCGLGFLNFLGTILFFVALVWVVRLFVRGGFRSGGWGGWRRWRRVRRGLDFGADDALEEARSRLARGEIDAHEYERLRAALGGEGGDWQEHPFEHWFGGPPDAMQVLRLRLARGEITVEEFRALRSALQD